MSVVKPLGRTGTVAWLGLVERKRAAPDIVSAAVETLELDWGGPVGDVHHGETRGACVRVKSLYPRGTEIRNVRQLSILSAEELAEIAEALEIPELRPEWVGATLVLRGIPDLTLLPPATRLVFEGGATLVTDTENLPCKFPAEVIERHHPGHGRAFPKIARGKRGLTAWVERPGRIALGAAATPHVPPQRIYPHA
ncbi:MAG: MOSC domain-containing protein [Paracoccaceae bacterium]